MKMFYQNKLAPICSAFILAALPVISSAQSNQRIEHLGYPNEASGPHLYEKEIRACNYNSQNRAACIREAGAAQQLRRQGRLTNNTSDFRSNALKRCAVLPHEDRGACKARIMGHGTIEGSVDGGGVIREIRTPVDSGYRDDRGPRYHTYPNNR